MPAVSALSQEAFSSRWFDQERFEEELSGGSGPRPVERTVESVVESAVEWVDLAELEGAPGLTTDDEPPVIEVGARSSSRRRSGGSGGGAQGDPAARRARLRELMFRARKLTEGRPRSDELFPSGVAAVDGLLAGGLMRGEMVEVVGWRSSGRFSLVLSLLAATTQAGEPAALVDLGDQLDPQQALAAGIDLERLLWLRPESVKQAMGSAEMVLTTGFPLVVLDLGVPPVPGGRGAEAGWLRLQRAAQDHGGALLVAAPYRASGTAAQAVLELRPVPGGAGGWLGRGAEPKLLGGLRSRAALSKSRLPRLRGLASKSAVSDSLVESVELRRAG